MPKQCWQRRRRFEDCHSLASDKAIFRRQNQIPIIELLAAILNKTLQENASNPAFLCGC